VGGRSPSIPRLTFFNVLLADNFTTIASVAGPGLAKIGGVRAAAVGAGATRAFFVAEEIDETHELYKLAQRARELTMDSGNAATDGSRIHHRFDKLVKDLGRDDLHSEITYRGGKVVPYGTAGGARVDALYGSLRRPTMIVDLKTGGANSGCAKF